ncbi:MAG: hypothetical protein ACLUKO_16250 [Enterocloster bolteae]
MRCKVVALIAWAGIDPPPYESDSLSIKRKITKRGSSPGKSDEVMRVLRAIRLKR